METSQQANGVTKLDVMRAQAFVAEILGVDHTRVTTHASPDSMGSREEGGMYTVCMRCHMYCIPSIFVV